MKAFIVFDKNTNTVIARYRGGEQSIKDLLTLNGYDETIQAAIRFEIPDDRTVDDYIVGANGQPKLSAAGADAIKDRKSNISDEVLKAFALVVLDVWNGILAPTTVAELKAAVKAKL